MGGRTACSPMAGTGCPQCPAPRPAPTAQADRPQAGKLFTPKTIGPLSPVGKNDANQSLGMNPRVVFEMHNIRPYSHALDPVRLADPCVCIPSRLPASACYAGSRPL